MRARREARARRAGRSALRTPIVLLCAAMIVAAAALAPGWLLSAEDSALMSAAMERRRIGGGIAAGGEDLYMVRTVAARAAALRQGGAGAGFVPLDLPAGELRPMFTARLEAMAKAGVLPASVCARLSVLAASAGGSIGCASDAAGFREIVCAFGEEGEYACAGMELEPRTGRAARFWLMVRGQASAADAAPVLDAYAVWLGVEGLSDWQSVDSIYYSELRVSQTAQMQLYALYKGNVLMFGIQPLEAGSGAQGGVSGGYEQSEVQIEPVGPSVVGG